MKKYILFLFLGITIINLANAYADTELTDYFLNEKKSSEQYLKQNLAISSWKDFKGFLEKDKSRCAPKVDQCERYFEITAPLSEDIQSRLSSPYTKDSKCRYYSMTGESSIVGDYCILPDAENILDWEILFQLNFETKKVWEQILACSKGDMRLAKKHYYEANNFCPNIDENQKIIEQLTKLHANTKDFLLSTSIHLDAKQGLIYFLDERLEKMKELISIHPLLAQILIEIQSTIVKYSDYAEVDYPYIPSFRSRLDFVQNAKAAIGQEYSTAKLYYNSHQIVALLDSKNLCQGFGLWPELGGWLSNISDYQSSSRLLTSLVQFTELATCSEKSPLYINSSTQKDWHTAKALIAEFRGIADRYGLKINTETTCKFHFTGIVPTTRCFSIDPAVPGEKL